MRALLERGWKMRTVKVNKKELLEKIRINKKAHIAEYNEAVEGYQKAAVQELSDLNASLKTNPLTRIATKLVIPVSHEKDYTQVIAMLEMEVEETVEVESDQFACYVLDDWDWKAGFNATNSMYKSSR